jgi:pimeloyl-ACP methyl ester carboxylesterase
MTMSSITRGIHGGLHLCGIEGTRSEEGVSPPALLWIHGLGESALCFERIMADPRLQGWRQLAPDLPGYGKSPWRAEPLDLSAQAEVLAGLISDRDAAPAVIIGHSMGGVSGLLLAERHPELVRAFINVEGNVTLDDCSISRPVSEQTVEELLEGGFERLLDIFYRQGREDRALRGYYASVRHCDPRQYHLNSTELVELSAGGELARRLAALPCPLLYLLGEPRGTGEFSRSRLDEAGVQWRAVPGAGHWPFLDQPGHFLDLLTAFLNRL